MTDRRMKNPKPSVGLMCSIHYKEYVEKRIKVHEKTLDKTIKRLKRLYSALGAYTGFPILFSEFGGLYGDLHNVAASDKSILQVHLDGVDHQIFEISDAINQKALDYFTKVGAVYVADGHHRLKAYTSLIESTKKMLEKKEGLSSGSESLTVDTLYVHDPNQLPVICRPHSLALIKKSKECEENKKKLEVKNRKGGARPSLIIRENSKEQESESIILFSQRFFEIIEINFNYNDISNKDLKN